MKTRSVFALGLGLGIGLGAVITGLISGPSANAQIAPLTPQRQGTQVMLDERKLESVYANGYRLHTSAEEVIADLGFNMPNPNAGSGAQSADLLFDVRMRLIMSFATAKRFQESLGTLVKRYEDLYGPIRTEPPQPKAGAGSGTASMGTGGNP